MSSNTSRRKELERIAINPVTGKSDLVLHLSYDKVNTILHHRNNIGDVQTIIHTIPDALTKPCAIFEGIRFEEDEKHSCNAHGWLCYCYKPDFRYTIDGSKIPAPIDKIFLVFVNVEYIIYHWTWERVDIDSLQSRQPLPVNYKTRFNKKII
jgi:hypothetical protein